MTQIESGREQDQGREHRKRGDPSAATSARLERWYSTLRNELDAVIAALDERSTQTTMDGSTPPAIPLEDARRDRLIERGAKIARELGGEVDPAAQGTPGGTRRRGPVKVDMG